MIQFLSVAKLLARRSIAAHLAVPLIVVGCWSYLYSPDAPWLGRWLELSLSLHGFQAIIVGPTIAGACAWDLMRTRRRGDLLLASAFHSYAADATARLVAGLGWSTLVLTVVTLAASGRNLFHGLTGFPAASILALSLGLTCIEIAAALAIVTVVPSIASVGGFLLACYGAIFVHSRQQMRVGPRRFFPLIEEHWDPWAAPLDGRLILATVWCLGLSVLVLCTVGVFTTRPSGVLPTATAVVSALALGFAMLAVKPTSADSYFSAVRLVRDSVCADDSPGRVCVWTPDAFQLPLLRKGYAQAARAADGAVEMPVLLREQGLPDGGADSSIEFFFTTAPADANDVSGKLLEELTPVPAETCASLLNVESLGGFPLHFVVGDVLLGRAGIETTEEDPGLASAVQRVADAPRAAQDRWLRSAVSAIHDCGSVPPLPAAAP